MANDLKLQSDDVACLIQHLSPGRPVMIFASSGSGVMAAEVLQSHPGLVRKLILHEPLLLSLFSLRLRTHIHNQITERILAYGGSGNASIRRALMPTMQGKRDQRRFCQIPHPTRLLSQLRDQPAPFHGYELPQILDYEVHVENLKPYQEKLVLTKGEDISPEFTSAPQSNLSKALGIPVVVAPGGHTGHITDAQQFSKKLIAVLGFHITRLGILCIAVIFVYDSQ
ncbi:hypothetical protein BDV28DRAFT_60981 [Aspergillus coremiiformis]|uniref:AB hydrolase-1 domain-containing protein n=1 Tax=Aspergillus coremiiformis TaxID=138285 RepID=A0A5N6YYE5_9EURO|nr:hypothetical protein BDV28DRAFT_60981 [Aspergillus coremiiformis]